jgi:hypothetical protein
MRPKRSTARAAAASAPVQRVLAQVRERQPGAARRERPRDGAAEVAGRAGDEHRGAVEILGRVHVPCPRRNPESEA